jgi:hypothetical protein
MKRLTPDHKTPCKANHTPAETRIMSQNQLNVCPRHVTMKHFYAPVSCPLSPASSICHPASLLLSALWPHSWTKRRHSSPGNHPLMSYVREIKKAIFGTKVARLKRLSGCCSRLWVALLARPAVDTGYQLCTAGQVSKPAVAGQQWHPLHQFEKCPTRL